MPRPWPPGEARARRWLQDAASPAAATAPHTCAPAPPLSRATRGTVARMRDASTAPYTHARPASFAAQLTAPPTTLQYARVPAHCRPGVVVSARRAQQVQWLRSGAAEPEGRGGSEAVTLGGEGAGSAVAGRQRGACGSGSARARR